MLGIIGAMDEEIENLLIELDNKKEEKIANEVFYSGKLENKEVVIVKSGIGKVNSSVCTTILIERFNVDQIIFTGVAGGINFDLDVGDVVISRDLIQHDFDCTAFGAKPGEIPRMKEYIFKSNEKLMKLAKKSAEKIIEKNRVIVGRVASGDQFITDKEDTEKLREIFKADCTEMEGASVAQVCYLYNIPFVVIRSISDKADHSAHVDFKEFVIESAITSKKIVLNMLKES